MRYYDEKKAFLIVTSLVTTIIGLFSVLLVLIRPNFLFGNIQIILGVLITLIAVFITYVAFFRMKSLQERLQDEMHILKNQTSEMEDRLIKTLKDSTYRNESVSGFAHLQDKVEKFVSLYPYEKNVVFLASFSGIYSEKLYRSIKDSLSRKGYRLLRASDQQVAPDIFSNVVVLLLGCKYGIALFDASEERNWANPNVAFELGIMFTLGRKVLLLKDSRLPRLPTDIAGHIYIEFKSPEDIPEIIERWFSEVDAKGSEIRVSARDTSPNKRLKKDGQ